MDFLKDENIWLYLPLTLWVSGIFYLSSGKGSISNTSRFLRPAFSFLFPQTKAESLRKYHLIFRKLCHFIGYGILALFASLVFYNSSAIFLTRFWYICAFILVLAVAAADEIKQSFYASRLGSVSDVILDCLGGLTTIFLFLIFAE